MLGLGRRGGARPDRVEWTWKVENHQEGVWLGGIHKGLQYVLRDDNYVRPLNTNFYQNQPLNLPRSWYNEGRGGIRIETLPGAVVATNYSGARTMQAGATLHFNARFLITPFKPIDIRTHFNTRFVHRYVPVDEVKASGGTVVNIHHAHDINPYINYPFFNLDKQAAYINEAHAKGIKVYAPEVKGLQAFEEVDPTSVTVPAGQGCFSELRWGAEICLVGVAENRQKAGCPNRQPSGSSSPR